MKPTLLAALALLIAVAACASGPNGAQPKASAPLTKVHVAAGNPMVSRIPYFIALSKGFMKDEGLDVDSISMSGGGADAAKLMASNSVDILLSMVSDAININKAGVHALGVGTITARSTNVLLLRKDLAGKIKTLADVRGGDYPIGVSGIGGGSWTFVVYAAARAGVSKDELNFVAVPSNSAEAAFRAGRIALASGADPAGTQIVRNGVAERMIDLADEKLHQEFMGGDYINDQITVSESVIKSKPAVVQSFVNGIQRSLNWMKSSQPDEIAAEIRKTEGMDFDQEVLLETLRRMQNVVPRTAVISREAFDHTMRVPLTTGVLEQPLPFETLVDNQFADAAAKKLAPAS
jgi:NitT/TauT family transport system substrate-binding protein